MPEASRSFRSWRRLRLLFTGLLALAVLPSWASAQDGFYDVPPVLRSGDLLRVEVWQRPEFSGEFVVTAEGGVVHPLYRQIRVAGRPIEAVEVDLRRFLQQYFEEPALVVEGLVRIAVGGQVRQPDVYPLTLDTSVARAVALAGGPTERGAMNRVIIRRNGERYRLDLTSSEARLRDLEVRSGDEIVVERRSDFFRDYFVPWASVAGAMATFIRLFM